MYVWWSVWRHNSWYYRSLFVLVLGMGVGGLLRAQRRPRLCCHFTGHFYVAFSKEICCMPLQMLHYCYDKQVWSWNWKSFLCIFNVNKSFFVIFTNLDVDNNVRRKYLYLFGLSIYLYVVSLCYHSQLIVANTTANRSLPQFFVILSSM